MECKSFSLFGQVIDDDGYQWKIRFYIRFGRINQVSVVMTNRTKRRVYRAPKDVSIIATKFPVELWPQFAQHLAVNKSVNSAENESERLF